MNPRKPLYRSLSPTESFILWLLFLSFMFQVFPVNIGSDSLFQKTQKQHNLLEWPIVRLLGTDVSALPPAFVHPAEVLTWPGFQVYIPDFRPSGRGGPAPDPRRGGKASTVEQSFSASQKMRISAWCFMWSFWSFRLKT